MNKKILVICDRFSPETGVGGLRSSTFVKYLSQMDWTCEVLATVNSTACMGMVPNMPPTLKVSRVLITDLEKSQRLASRRRISRQLQVFIQPETYPYPLHCEEVRRKAFELVNQCRPDIVFVSTGAIFPIDIGDEISKRLGIPFVADFRDIPEERSQKQSVQRWLFDRRSILRRNRLMQSASHITVVSGEHERILQRYHPFVTTIPNGFDPDVFQPSSRRMTPLFVVSYTGRMISRNATDPSLFLMAVESLVRSGRMNPAKISVRFFGTEESLVRPLITPLLESIVQVYPTVNYQDVCKVLQDSTILLLLTAGRQRGVLTTKLYEYMAVGRPILCVPDDGDALQTFFSRHAVGKICDSVIETEDFLLRCYREWKDKGFVDTGCSLGCAAEFSRKKQTETLSSLLTCVIERSRSKNGRSVLAF